eukprot:5325295-Amphidinium_carterae.2
MSLNNTGYRMHAMGDLIIGALCQYDLHSCNSCILETQQRHPISKSTPRDVYPLYFPMQGWTTYIGQNGKPNGFELCSAVSKPRPMHVVQHMPTMLMASCGNPEPESDSPYNTFGQHHDWTYMC